MWEHLYVIIDNLGYVQSINEKSVDKPGLFNNNPGIKVWDFLNSMGHEGWEVVTMAITHGNPQVLTRILILKRQIDGSGSNIENK